MEHHSSVQAGVWTPMPRRIVLQVYTFWGWYGNHDDMFISQIHDRSVVGVPGESTRRCQINGWIARQKGLHPPETLEQNDTAGGNPNI